MATCPTCQTSFSAGECPRCALFAAGSPVMLTVALTPDGGPGVGRYDSRYPITPPPADAARGPITPTPDRLLSAALLAVTPATPTPPTITAKLRVIRGQRVNAEYPVYPGRNVLGRFADKPVDIDLTGIEPDGQVWSSRRHAALTLDRAMLVVEDLNSLNGTWVNGTRLRAGAALPLRAGDVIQIGVAQLRVEIDPV